MTKKLYIGTKLINAIPMTRQESESLLGRNIGGNRHGAGYLVTYEDGYQSWSPADVFDAAYRPTDRMTFGDALVMLKQGKRVCRAGWNGNGMWLKLVHGGEYELAPGMLDHLQENPCNPRMMPWIGMKTSDDGFVPWLASQTDMLAEDWMLLEDNQ